MKARRAWTLGSILFNFELQNNVLDLSHYSLFAIPKAYYHPRAVALGQRSLQSNEFFDARQVLDEESDWNVVSATTLLGQFSRSNRHKEVIYLYIIMLQLNIRPNEFTFGTVIPSSTTLKDLNLGRQLHGYAIKAGLASNVFVGSAMLSLYAKLSSIEEAQRVFEDTCDPNVVSYTTLMRGYIDKSRFDDAHSIFRAMPERNVVSWNAMISGCSQKGHNEEAVNLFIEMLREGLVPDRCTFPCVIVAASNIAAIGIGRSFHACAIKYLGIVDLFVANSLISFYAKCGCMDDSLLVFNDLSDKNVVSWNALICGFAQNGRGKEATEIYNKMQSSGLKPNSVTLLGILLACNHAGLVNEGYVYFNQARLKDPDMLKPEHYSCMVDMLSRSGRFEEAEKFIRDLPFDPGIGFWKALLGGCQIHSNMELGELAAKKIMALDPEDVSSYVLLSNAHSAAERWQNVSIVRHKMTEKGLQRVPGCSWIEIQSNIHVFVTRDEKHDQSDEIYMLLWIFLKHATDSKILL
ncbi:Pentatricopeptide repeat-containing protein [Heracleum sosnowskyi]|uniref:Pentatricopeptide repeat-containing protein n=1 Tax=Heracleum sosnowskyi TaxID=360622 RepID=A0AAD8IV01_9APIA|nr:Pentatricopeptide repeat-containing protein [Heracleum sosnowskyi]